MGRKSRWLAGARGFRRPRRLRPEALPFTKALPFKGRVGWGWCFSSLVISAQAGSQLLALSCFSNCRASTRLRRAGHFLDSGHPALRRYAASFAVRAAPAAQCLCKESNQRNTPPVAVSGHPALRLREAAPGFAECTSLYMQRTSARRARSPSDFPAQPRRATGGAVRAASCRRSKDSFRFFNCERFQSLCRCDCSRGNLPRDKEP